MIMRNMTDPSELFNAAEALLDDAGTIDYDYESEGERLRDAVRGVGYALIAIGRKMPEVKP